MKFKKAFFMTALGLVLINIFQFLFFYVKIDPYSMDKSFENNDPIYQDYKSIIDNLYSKEKYPVLYIYKADEILSDTTANKNLNILSAIGTLDGKTDKIITSSHITQQYINDINLNLYNLKKIDSAAHFRRNRLIANKWYQQFYSIVSIIEEKSTKQYLLENIKNMEVDSLRNVTSKEIYTQNIIELKNLEDYHKKIIQHHNNCGEIYSLGNAIINIPAYALDNLLDVLKPPKIKKESVRFDFEPLEDESYKKFHSK
ncbi:hypothetical protein [Frigoriflavimonas asaccharolytica]|uniref:Uncharacterized protein n=1 Tax=Frigoriflavimonas asaccharolytica TaxID=2735899 RepID=A0A8J8G6V7_9FLAO|nr:hypothetical protein [Frigoriflavimonas asaccharolytica]NRS92426.1 hypothetical protein [Frigoriflavimonas asaccharolytica]